MGSKISVQHVLFKQGLCSCCEEVTGQPITSSYLFNMWALLVLVFLFFQFFIRLHVFHFDQSFLINNKLTLSLRQQRPPAVICTDQCVCCLAYKQGLHNTRLQQLRVNDDTKKTLKNLIFPSGPHHDTFQPTDIFSRSGSAPGSPPHCSQRNGHSSLFLMGTWSQTERCWSWRSSLCRARKTMRPLNPQPTRTLN